ncbi:MAG: hypothetical protein KDB21_16705 [Acidimicrobiales bacterium]|nr:hypothetical protein [Acidimicrobiales bacterium]
MATVLIAVIAVIAVLVLLALVVGLAVSRLYRKVPQGKALVVSTMNKVLVTFTGRVVLPVLHKSEVMDISVKTIEIDRRGKEGLICGDNIRADIKVSFFVRVNKAEEDVIKVAQAIGVDRASQQITLEELFVPKFSEALKTVGKRLDFVDLYTERRRFRDEIIEVIGTDLNGYVLEDAAIDFLEQTPIAQLDEDNILDAQGIRKITELTAIQKVATNNATNEETKQITAKNVETREAVLELERQQADAEARQAREVATLRAREEAETAKVRAEETKRAEQARLTAEQEVGIQRENVQREIEVAAKNRERVTAVEEERIEKARALEVMARQVETTAAEKALETEKAQIADVRRGRVAVERTVAEQEESIKSLQVVEEANRQRESVIIAAEADAQAGLVRDIKAAEAAQQAAEHRAQERITLAKADLEAADLDSRSKVRIAEGTQAEMAAIGLAEAQVKEADATASEKLGMAHVRVREADAAVIERVGSAEASATEARLRGEAAGLMEKAAAMRELEGVGQRFEEFVRELDARKEIKLAEVGAQVDIARAQAEVVAKGLESADIDIVGGTDMFIDRLMGAAAAGKAVDAFVDNSETTRSVFGPYLDGDKSLLDDLGALTSGLGSDGVRDLTVAAFLTNLMGRSRPELGPKLAKVLDAARSEGIGEVPLRDLLG